MSEPLISLKNVSVRRDGFTLEVPEWTVQGGQVVGLVGPNGAGKSTLLELLPALLKPTAGTVSVLGCDPWAQPVSVRQRLGYMTDDLPVGPGRVRTVLATMRRYYPSWDDALVARLLERFQLDPESWPAKMSKGQGTRLRLLLALAHRPNVVVLDEPATGLDLSGRQALLQTVLEVVSDPGVAVIVSSHQLVDVERIADRLLVLAEGRVLREGPTDMLVGDERSLAERLIEWGAA